MNTRSDTLTKSAAILLAAMSPILVWPGPRALAAADSPGRAAYQKAGCAACHGAEAQGTEFAPMLPGHSADQVKRYTRKAQGKMPRYGPDMLSDSELQAIASYIEGLKPPETAAVKLPGALEMHHWIAHHSLRAGDAEHALVHLAHALELAKDDEHRRGMERVVGLVKAKRLPQAADAVVDLLGSKVVPETSAQRLHVRLALSALDAGDTRGLTHYLERYRDGASPHDKGHARELLALVRKGDLATVRSRLVHLLKD